MGRETVRAKAMWRRFFCLMFLLCCACVGAASAQQSRWQACLPADVKVGEIVSVPPSESLRTTGKNTLGRRLSQLKARCRRGRLVGARNRPVRFYRLTGCWGMPPPNYLEILERQRGELRELKRRYVVIEISCNPSGVPIP